MINPDGKRPKDLLAGAALDCKYTALFKRVADAVQDAIGERDFRSSACGGGSISIDQHCDIVVAFEGDVRVIGDDEVDVFAVELLFRGGFERLAFDGEPDEHGT